MTRQIGERVDISMPRKHKEDTGLRLKDACDMLIENSKLTSTFNIPNAAGALQVLVDLQKRTISCSMKLNAPDDRKRASSRINWITRQLRNVEGGDVIVRAFWPGRSKSTQALLQEIREDPGSMIIDRSNVLPVSFEILVISDLARRFSGQATFIEDLEKAVPDFYDRVGQNLREWVPPPPSIEKPDSKQTPKEAETYLDSESISSDDENQ